jgi:hypothetical protein
MINIQENGIYLLDMFSNLEYTVVSKVEGDVVSYYQAPFKDEQTMDISDFRVRFKSGMVKYDHIRKTTKLIFTVHPFEIAGMETALDGGQPWFADMNDVLNKEPYALPTTSEPGAIIMYTFGGSPHSQAKDVIQKYSEETN